MSRTYLTVPEAFSDEECRDVIGLAASGRAEQGPVYGSAGGRIDLTARNVRSTLLGRGAAPWLFERLDSLFAAAAEEFGLPVGPISEEIQILRYDVGSHFALWHTDSGLDSVERRRISVSVELSERGDYEGGELEVVPDLVARTRTLPRGSAQFFPSRALHRVTPVTRGTRWALVAWTGAPDS